MVFRRRARHPARREVERFEGWWRAEAMSPFPNIGGKIEWDGFDNGDSEIELFATIPGIPDGSEIVVMWGHVEVMTALAHRSVIKRDLETKDGDDVPRLAGEQVELVHDGAVIARTRLDPD